MKKTENNRKVFLKALIDYGNKSGNFNPHFHRKEMMKILDVNEREFNIIQKNLGEKYCYFVDSHNGDNRYAINMNECLELKEENDKHNQIVRLVILTAIFGAVLGTALSLWLK